PRSAGRIGYHVREPADDQKSCVTWQEGWMRAMAEVANVTTMRSIVALFTLTAAVLSPLTARGSGPATASHSRHASRSTDGDPNGGDCPEGRGAVGDPSFVAPASKLTDHRDRETAARPPSRDRGRPGRRDADPSGPTDHGHAPSPATALAGAASPGKAVAP